MADGIFNAISRKHLLAVMLAVMCVIEIRKGFFKQIPGYLKTLRFKPYALFLAVPLLAAVCMLPFDRFLIAKVQGLQYPWLDRFISTGAFLGKSHGVWGPLAFLYLIALLFRFEKAKQIFLGAVLSSALTGLTAHLMKFIALRARPFNDLGPYRFFDWQGFMEKSRAFQSFPSGDVAVVAGAAAFLFLLFRRFYFSAILLLFPLMTALSRMDLNKHWPSDTLFSILLSFAVAKLVLEYLEYRGDKTSFNESAK